MNLLRTGEKNTPSERVMFMKNFCPIQMRRLKNACGPRLPPVLERDYSNWVLDWSTRECDSFYFSLSTPEVVFTQKIEVHLRLDDWSDKFQTPKVGIIRPSILNTIKFIGSDSSFLFKLQTDFELWWISQTLLVFNKTQFK